MIGGCKCTKLLNAIANAPERFFEHFLRLLFGSHNLFHFVLYASHLRRIVNVEVVVDELDILAGRERPVLAFNLGNAHAAVEFRHSVRRAVDAFGLPSVANPRSVGLTSCFYSILQPYSGCC